MVHEFYQTVADKFIFKVKKGLLYTEDDVWAKVEDERVKIGATDFLQRRGGDILYVELSKVDDKVKQLQEIVQLETIKAVTTIASPFEGRVKEVNTLLDSKPELINVDPYGEGWLITISPSNLKKDSERLLTAEKYFDLMKSKIKDEAAKRKKEA